MNTFRLFLGYYCIRFSIWLFFILSLLFLLPQLTLAQTITLAALEGPINLNTWRLVFTAPGAWQYQASLGTVPGHLVINFEPGTQFNNEVNGLLFANSPLNSLTYDQPAPGQLRVNFAMKRPVSLVAGTVNGNPNQLILTLTETGKNHLNYPNSNPSPNPNYPNQSLNSAPVPAPVRAKNLQPTISNFQRTALATPNFQHASLKSVSSLVPAASSQHLATVGSQHPIASAKFHPLAASSNPNSLASSSPASLSYRKFPVVSQDENTHQFVRRIVIVIDPGHGGKDPGAEGTDGAKEKNVVLSISQKLQALINQQPGFHAYLTRSGDNFIPLRQRMMIARKDNADMFVAIHADAYLNHVAHGASVYALSSRGATSEAARWLAQRENQSELMGGVDLTDKEDVLRSVLINLSQTATIHASLLIGHNLLTELNHFSTLHYARVEQAAFVVLKSPDIPSLLVETGFISNNAEERNLQNSAYQQKIAEALMLGITHYFQQNPPPGTWLAERSDKSTVD